MLTSFFSKHIDAHAPFFFFFFLIWIHEWEGDLPGWSGWLSLHHGTSSGCNSSGTILRWRGDPTVSAMQNIRGETKAASHQGEHYFPAALWHPLASCGLGTSSSPGGSSCLIATDEICVCLFSSSYVCERQKPHVEVAGSFLWLVFAEAQRGGVGKKKK